MYRVAAKCGDSYKKDVRGYLASSRIRIHNLAKYWDECDDYFYPEEFNQTNEEFFNPDNQFKILKDYDVVILNKTYEWRLALRLKENHQFVVIDFCDPDFLLSHSSETRRNNCLQTLRYTDLCIVNGKEMKKELRKVYKGPIEIIPDRLDLQGLPQKEIHNDELKRIVWYGYSENLRVLEPYMKQIINMGLEITIISDGFFKNLILVGCKYKPKDVITYKSWHPETINKQILSTDCVFVGKDKDKYLSKFKSNNRALTGWAMGMPVAFDIRDLKKLKSREARIKNAWNGNRMVREKFDIRHSVFEYDKIIKKLINRRINANLNGHRKRG